jgi:hypothetical protein
VEFKVDKVALGQVYLRLLRLSLVSYHSTIASHTFINRQRWWRTQTQKLAQYRGLRSHFTPKLKITLRYIYINNIFFYNYEELY